MLDRILQWFTLEPAVSMLMVTTAIALFGSAFRTYQETSASFWPWLRRVIEAAVSAVLFLGLLWAFRTILNDNANTFYATHGSVSDISRSSAWSIWGRPHTQIELTVAHSHQVMEQEEIPQADPSKLPLYRTVTRTVEVPENSIVGFAGDVQMQLSEREKGYALYSGYTLAASLNYTVVNSADFATDAVFTFPLSQDQTLFENFIITLDGRDLSADLRFGPNLVAWSVPMQPHQQSVIVITYASRGMDYFYYQIPIQREIKDFVLTLTIDRLPVSLLNYPDRVITPTQIKPTPDGRGSILTWQLDRAITVAGMGVALLPPQQAGAQVLRVLVIAPYALTLLGAMLVLTLLIWGRPVPFLDLALLAGVYSMQFLLMAAVSDYFFGFWGALLLGAGLCLGLTFLLFRRLPSRPLRLIIYLLVAFFAVAYPLSGLLTELAQQNACNMLLQAGLILYLTGLSLYARAHNAPAPAPAA